LAAGCIAIIGGGAAGIFAAVTTKRLLPEASVIVLEKSAVLLSKVRVSGGGRCNVTHACFDPKQLVNNYPRGYRELLGPFHRFQPRDTIEWFESRGVMLKAEEDGRIFPVTDSSQTIIDCLLKEARELGVEIRLRTHLENISHVDSVFQLQLAHGEILQCDRLLLATGSHPQGFQFAESFGHTIVTPVPSLFTFNIPTSPLHDLSGITLDDVELTLAGGEFIQRGPLLLTHWGFSGPAALKLSAWAARWLHAKEYQAPLSVNWMPNKTREALLRDLINLKLSIPQVSLSKENPFHLPKNLWRRLLELCALDEKKRMAGIAHRDLERFADRLHADLYPIHGKTTNKEEFVTCGGVNLKEIDFKRMESRVCPGLFFAGEILDIDAVTGGFNFQNAWTTAWIAAHAIFEPSKL
jgi:hypothetical protein